MKPQIWQPAVNEEYLVFPTTLPTLPIPMEDAPLHTLEHPVCDDPTCPCQEEVQG